MRCSIWWIRLWQVCWPIGICLKRDGNKSGSHTCTPENICADLGKVLLHPSFRELPQWAFVGVGMRLFHRCGLMALYASTCRVVTGHNVEVAISKGMAALTTIRSSVVLPKMIQVMNGLIWIKMYGCTHHKYDHRWYCQR